MSLNSKILQILDSSACLSKGQLSGYLSRSLYPEELRAVELHLSECPFCSDALDGFEQEQSSLEALSRIDRIPTIPTQLAPREKRVEAVLDKVVKTVAPKTSVAKTQHDAATGKNKHNKTISNISGSGSDMEKPTRSRWLKPLSIAAGLLVITTLLWYFQFSEDRSKKNNYIAGSRSSEGAEAGDSNASVTAPVHGPIAQNLPVKVDTVAVLKTIQPVTRDTVNTRGQSIQNKEVAKEQTADPEAKQASVAVADIKAETLKAAPAVSLKTEKDDLAEAMPAESNREKSAKQDEKMSDYEMGVELYKQKQYGSALLYLKPAQRNSSDPRHYDAVYYSALCYKNSGQKKKAVQLFKTLIEEGAPQKSSAQKQLKELGED